MTNLRTSALAALLEQLIRGHGGRIPLPKLEAELEARAISTANLANALTDPRLQTDHAPDQPTVVTLATTSGRLVDTPNAVAVPALHEGLAV